MHGAFPLFTLFFSIFFMSVTVEPSSQRWRFFPFLAALYIYIITNTSTGSIALNFYVGLPISILLTYACDLILINDPQTSLRRLGQESAACDMPLISRMYWAGDLVTNLRGINWSFEAPHLRRSILPRWVFVRSQLSWAIGYYILNDAISAHNRWNSAFHSKGELMGAHGSLWQTWNAMAFWFTFATSMSMNHSLFSAIAVATGVYEPEDWPHFFGRWSDTTSIRIFWGRTWQQVLRRPITTHGKYFANNIMGFAPGTKLSSYTQLYVAFLLSGTFHAAADWMMMHEPRTALSILQFFILQALAITFEDAINGIQKRVGVLGRSRALGYMWVIAWFGWSGPFWMEPMIRAGMLEAVPPISLVNRLLAACEMVGGF